MSHVIASITKNYAMTPRVFIPIICPQEITSSAIRRRPSPKGNLVNHPFMPRKFMTLMFTGRAYQDAWP